MPHRRQRNERLARDKPGLLGEFAQGGGEQFLAGIDQSLRDCPNARVFVLPKWPAGMREQDLKSFMPSERQDARADLLAAHGAPYEKPGSLRNRASRSCEANYLSPRSVSFRPPTVFCTLPAV